MILRQAIATVIVFSIASGLPALASKTFTLGTQESSRYVNAEVVASPRPEIPAQLEESGLKSYCLARFVIKPDGKTSVTLVSSTGSDEADEIAIKTLQKWRFKPATLDGKPVESTRKLRIEFEID